MKYTINALARCPWVPSGDLLYAKYHDTEWGVPVHADKKIFEFLLLEMFQAGLSWRTVLAKRQNFKKAFAEFDHVAVARFGARDVRRLMQDAGIIRNRAKITAAVVNAQKFLEVRKEYGTFSRYMWTWVGGKPMRHALRGPGDYMPLNSDAVLWARDLKQRGFSFLGPTVLYAHMQATGMVNDHVISCFRYTAMGGEKIRL